MLLVPLSPRLAPALFLLSRLRSLPLCSLLAFPFLPLPLHSPFLGLIHEALNYETRRHEIMPAVDVSNGPFGPHFSGDLAYLFG